MPTPPSSGRISPGSSSGNRRSPKAFRILTPRRAEPVFTAVVVETGVTTRPRGPKTLAQSGVRPAGPADIGADPAGPYPWTEPEHPAFDALGHTRTLPTRCYMFIRIVRVGNAAPIRNNVNASRRGRCGCAERSADRHRTALEYGPTIDEQCEGAGVRRQVSSKPSMAGGGAGQET